MLLIPWAFAIVAAFILYVIIRSAVRFGVREGLRDHELWKRGQR